MLENLHNCNNIVNTADLPAPGRDVGCSKKYLYFLRPSGWCQTASGRLIPQLCTQRHVRNQRYELISATQNNSGLERTLQCWWCAVCPSVLLLLTVEVRLTSSSSGMIWSLTGGSCVCLLSAGTWKSSPVTEKNKIKVKVTTGCTAVYCIVL